MLIKKGNKADCYYTTKYISTCELGEDIQSNSVLPYKRRHYINYIKYIKPMKLGLYDLHGIWTHNSVMNIILK